MSGTNIKVAIRARPLITSEIQKKLKSQWSIKGNNIYQINTDEEIIGEPYSFDHIFPSNKSNKDIYDVLVDPFIDSTLNGINSTIFAYGQTSSGKTYTMLGNDTDSGIMSLAIQKIFDAIDDCLNRKFLLRISYIEIYNEVIIDLFNSNKDQKTLKIRESNGQICLQGITEEFVSKREEVFDLIKLGNKNRHIAGTNMNERSSRSHTIFRIMIESTEINDFDSKEHPLQISNLNFVDLAGSERVAQTKATGVRLKEGNFINKSLSALSLVIKQLSDGQDFVNFRDSKLTRLLQDSLGGNSNTLIITTITTTSVEDTLSTLNFAQRAKTVKNKPIINKIVSKERTGERYEELIRQLSQQLEEQMNKNKNLEVEKDENSEHILHLQKQLNMLNNFQKNVVDFNDIDLNIPKRRHTIGFLKKQQLQLNKQQFNDNCDFSFLTTSTRTTMTPQIKEDSDSIVVGDFNNDNNNDVSNLSTLSTPKYAIRERLLFLQQDLNDLTDYTRHEQDTINELSLKINNLEMQLSAANCNQQKQMEIIDKLKSDLISIKNQRLEESDILIEQIRNKFVTREKELLDHIERLEDELMEKNYDESNETILNDCDRKDILNQLYQLEEMLIVEFNDNQQKQEIDDGVLNNFKQTIDQYLLNIQSEIFNKIDKTKIIVQHRDFDELKTSVLEYFDGGCEERIDTIQNINILENLFLINEDLSIKSNTLGKLVEENLQLNCELTKHKEQLIAYQKDNSELKQQLNDAHKNFNDLTINNDLMKNQFSDIESKCDELNKQIVDLTSINNKYKLEKIDLIDSYEYQITELDKKNLSKLRDYQEQIVELNKRVTNQMVEFKNIQLENEDLHKNLYKQDHLLVDKNNETDLLRNEIVTLKNTISKLETENENFREQLTDFNQLTESINSYKLQIDNLNNKLEKYKLSSSFSSFQEQIEELNRRINNQMVEFKNIQLENEGLHKNLYKQYNLLDDKNNEISLQKNEIITLKNTISKLEIENENFKQKLTDYNELAESINSYKLQINHLNDKLKEKLSSTSSSSSSTAATKFNSDLKENLERYQWASEEMCRLNLAYIRSILTLSNMNTGNEILQNPQIRDYVSQLYNNSCGLRDKCAILRTRNPSNVDLYQTVEIIKKSLNLFKLYNSDSLDLWNLKIKNLEQQYQNRIDEQKASCKQCKDYRKSNEESQKLQNKFFKMYMTESDKNSELREKITSKDEQIEQLKGELWHTKNTMRRQSIGRESITTKDCGIECNIVSMEMLETLTIKYEQVKAIARARQQTINQLKKQGDN